MGTVTLIKIFLPALVVLHQQASPLLPSGCCEVPRCICTWGSYGYKADCSSLSLKSVPKFEDNVTDINLSHNKNFTIMGALQNLPKHLRKLDLSSCNIREIHEGFVRQFTHLEYLDISFNRELTLDVLTNVSFDLQFTSIKVLKFEALQCVFGHGVTLKLEHTFYLRNTSLREINFSSNRIEEIEQFVLSNFPSTLRNITASDNRFKFGWYALEINSFPNLEFVNISYQHFSTYNYLSVLEDIHCNDSRKASTHIRHPFNVTFQRQGSNRGLLNTSCLEKYHSLSHQRVKFYICLPQSLKTLIVGQSNSLHSRKFGRHIYFDFTSLETLDESGIHELGFGNKIVTSNLTEANFSYNFFDFIEPLFFRQANLTVLDLTSNYMGGQIRQSRYSELLHDQKFLQNLSLSENNIHSIPYNFFETLSRLQNLDLSDNVLSEVTFEVRTLIRLKNLNLRKNYIKAFSESNMEAINEINRGQLRLDLSQNDILCSCETIDFLKWMEQNKIIFTRFETYTCSFPNTTKANLSDLHNLVLSLEKECASYVAVIAVTVIIITTSLTIVTVTLLHRFRWRLRYVYYMVKRSHRQKRTSNPDDNNTSTHKYYAFISYSDDDRQIALHGSKTNVEDKMTGVKLCFHQRDFLPGFSIAENIANAINASRKVVCFVSDSFLDSDWCMYEFNMALMENIHGNKEENFLFLVLMKGFDTRKAPLSMLEFIRSNCYIEYPDDKSYEPWFWSNVCEAISN